MSEIVGMKHQLPLSSSKHVGVEEGSPRCSQVRDEVVVSFSSPSLEIRLAGRFQAKPVCVCLPRNVSTDSLSGQNTNSLS